MLTDALSTVTLHPSLVLAVPSLLVIGYILKQTPAVPDWLIVWILIILGVSSGVVEIGANLEGVANGIIAAGLAIASHQTLKQTVRRQ